MSFSSKVKEELIQLPRHERHCAVAELSAIIQFSGKVKYRGEEGYALVLHTENIAVAKRFYTLLREVSHVHPKILVSQHEGMKRHHVFTISVDCPQQALQLLKMTGMVNNLGQLNEEVSPSNLPVVKKTCCRRAFLRGAFLAAGSVTNPEKNYHFEIVCTESHKAEQLKHIMDYFGLDAKIVLRKKYHVVYLKEGSMISDALNIMEAHVALMQFENVRIVKDVRNSVNRRVNCEAANINKTVSAARRQIEDIEYIQKTVGLDKLPDALKDVAYARLEEPEAALKELGEMLMPPVGKSGVNHRLRKLSRMAQNIKEGGCI